MALPKQEHSVVYTAGQNQGVEDYLTQEQFTLIRNGQYRKQGGIVQRGGFGLLDFESDDVHYMLTSDNKRVALLSANAAASFSNEAGINGNIESLNWYFNYANSTGPRSSNSLEHGDCAYWFNYATGERFVCFTYIKTKTVASEFNLPCYQVINLTTGAIFAQGVLTSGADYVMTRVEEQSGKYVCFFSRTSNNRLYARTVDAATGVLAGGTIVVTSDLDGTQGMFAVSGSPGKQAGAATVQTLSLIHI